MKTLALLVLLLVGCGTEDKPKTTTHWIRGRDIEWSDGSTIKEIARMDSMGGLYISDTNMARDIWESGILSHLIKKYYPDPVTHKTDPVKQEDVIL